MSSQGCSAYSVGKLQEPSCSDALASLETVAGNDPAGRVLKRLLPPAAYHDWRRSLQWYNGPAVVKLLICGNLWPVSKVKQMSQGLVRGY